MKYLSLIALASLFVACSSEDSNGSKTVVPCNQDPWSCPAGQTCWLNDLAAGTFKCLNSAAGVAKGAACQNIVGSPTCGDGLACLQLVGGSTGACTTFCDRTKADRGCAAGEDCVQVMVQGASSSFFACAPRAVPGDAGTDAPADTGSAADSGADAGSDSADGG